MADNGETTETPVAPVLPGGEETMSVNVKGKARDVMTRLGAGIAVAPVEIKKTDKTDELIKALENPKNVYSVKRTEPEDFKGAKTRREVHSGECPASFREITEFIAKNHGGEKYRIAVSDGETGKLITADRFTIADADPILPRNQQDADLERILMTPQKKGATELASDSIEKQTELALKQAEFERARQTLEEVRGAGKKTEPAPGASPVEQRLARLEQLLVEERYQNKVAALEQQIVTLRAAQAAPPKSNLEEMFLKFMEKSDEKFERMFQKQQDDKLNAMLLELKALREKPAQGGNDLLTQITALKKIGGMLGWSTEEEDDEEEPKEWWEILMKDHLPRLWDLLDGKKGEGKSMTKEEIVAEMNKMADVAAAEAVAKARARNQLPAPNVAPVLPPPVAVPALPAPVALPQQAPRVPVPTVTAPSAVTVPVPAATDQPAAAPAPAPAPVQAAAPPPEKLEEEMLTVEQETVVRIAKVMMILEREMALRPRDYSWNAIAWDSLPEDHADALAAVAEPAGIPAIFSNVLKPEKIAEMANALGTPKIAAFVKRGLDEFKEWYEKAKLNSDFDPFAEEDEPE